MERCRNCRIPCDENYCNICSGLRECQLCGRRLSERLFTLNDTVCDICTRKNQHANVRTAIGGIVEEQEIPTLETDSDLHIFMDQHENEIMQSLEQAVNRHRLVGDRVFHLSLHFMTDLNM